jgi:hypothetical protein
MAASTALDLRRGPVSDIAVCSSGQSRVCECFGGGDTPMPFGSAGRRQQLRHLTCLPSALAGSEDAPLYWFVDINRRGPRHAT